MHFFNPSLTQIDVNETRRYAGLHQTPFSQQLIEAACREAQSLCTPKAVWQDYAYDSPTGRLQAALETIPLTGQSITRHLANAKRVIVLSATVGSTIEQSIDQYFKQGDYTYALLLDAAATAAVESTADAVEELIRAAFTKQGLMLLPRFSPGYGDFDIHFQPQMLKLSMAQQIGLHLTESYMLSPRKSITALIGLTASAASLCRIPAKSCQTCSQTNCLSRKEPFSHDKTI